ncbi:hypothetical protein BDV23DRAFT_142767 [Aspergillus alliaceus]|uniref:Uncharacterized protein n=1 Tax=Petromyces alliaceus TaxID=209559 RepID=A0A5N7CRA7_PETAA|nr:hypothetical protein BDV23DRAFT_142767 [Aspergillus alliaceus]
MGRCCTMVSVRMSRIVGILVYVTVSVEMFEYPVVLLELVIYREGLLCIYIIAQSITYLGVS